MRLNQRTKEYFLVGDDEGLGYEEKLARYEELADAYFRTEEFEEFCADVLPHLDELTVDYVESAEFDELLVGVDPARGRARAAGGDDRALPQPHAAVGGRRAPEEPDARTSAAAAQSVVRVESRVSCSSWPPLDAFPELGRAASSARAPRSLAGSAGRSLSLSIEMPVAGAAASEVLEPRLSPSVSRRSSTVDSTLADIESTMAAASWPASVSGGRARARPRGRSPSRRGPR